MKSSLWNNVLDLNIDALLNPFIPRNRVDALPSPIAHFLGYRSRETKEPPALVSLPLVFLATVAGLCLVGGIYTTAPGIAQWNPPTLVASLGASAILDYNTISSPLSQPRNVIVGHTLAAIVGVAVSKLFQLNPAFDEMEWVAAAVGCACSSLVMTLTNTVHPPGGATAVLASADTQVRKMGWMFPPLILLASCLMTAVACLLNNTLRCYPVYWWTPQEVGQKLPGSASRREAATKQDVESGSLHEVQSRGSDNTLHDDLNRHVIGLRPVAGTAVWSLRSQLPADLELSGEEAAVLERLELRMREHAKELT